MKTKEITDKEKEREERLKQLRRDLEEKLAEQLPAEMTDPGTRVEIQKIDEGEALDHDRAKQVIEALLFASTRPLTVQELKRTIRTLSAREIENAIGELQADYEAGNRSFRINEIAGGYEVATRKEFAPWICKIELQRKARQATQSALETLAILAYKQPVTRAEVETLRGVDVSGVLNTLMARGLIKIVGKKEIPGRPFLYATTEKFLEHFGLNTLNDLPNLDEIRGLVENSVKKEELLGTQKIVSVEDAPEPSGGPSSQGDTEFSHESEPTSQEDRPAGQ